MKIKNSLIRDALYTLRTHYGSKATLKMRDVTTNYLSGERTEVDTVVKTIRNAIVLPEVLDASLINLLGSVVQANHGLITSGTRLAIVDGRQLRGATISIGMIVAIDSVDMEVASLPLDLLSGQGYLLVFRRKA